MRRASTIHVLGILLAAGLVAGCSGSNTARSDATKTPAQSSAASLAVTVEPVQAEKMGDTITATGSVAAWQELVVSAETNGVAIAEVVVDEGATVKKGDLLARLDDGLLVAQVAQQQAAIDEAMATLDSAKAAEARGEKLLASSNVSKETQEDRITARKTAEARLAAAKAALALLHVQLDRTRIVAPADGLVAKRSAVPGAVVQTGTELFRIVRDGRLEVAAKVAEQHLGAIHEGQTVTVTDAAGAKATGQVRAVSPIVDATTRLGTVYVALADGSALKPGMSARIAIATQPATVLTVPEAALVWREGKANVFTVAADSSVSLHPVAAGVRANGRVAVDGIAVADRVVTAGAGFLNDGDKVRVVVADATAAAK